MNRAFRLFAAFIVLGMVFHGLSTSSAADAPLQHLFGSGSQIGGKRITLRVKLAIPAPQGGVKVALKAS